MKYKKTYRFCKKPKFILMLNVIFYQTITNNYLFYTSNILKEKMVLYPNWTMIQNNVLTIWVTIIHVLIWITIIMFNYTWVVIYTCLSCSIIHVCFVRTKYKNKIRKYKFNICFIIVLVYAALRSCAYSHHRRLAVIHSFEYE